MATSQGRKTISDHLAYLSSQGDGIWITELGTSGTDEEKREFIINLYDILANPNIKITGINGILWAYEQRRMFSEMGNLARKIVEKRADWERNFKCLLIAYDQVLQQPLENI